QGDDLRRGEGAVVDADVVDVALELVGGLQVSMAADPEVGPAVVDNRLGVRQAADLGAVEVELRDLHVDHRGEVMPAAVGGRRPAAAANPAARSGRAADPFGALGRPRTQPQQIDITGAEHVGGGHGRGAADVEGAGAVPQGDG